MKELELHLLCVNFAAIMVITLQKHFNCLTKHTGRTVRAEGSAMSGWGVLKMAECRSVKIADLDDLPQQKKKNERRKHRQGSCCDSWKWSFNCPRRCWRSGRRHRILPSNFYWKTSDASRQCKIRAVFVNWRSERELCWYQSGTACQSKW